MTIYSKNRSYITMYRMNISLIWQYILKIALIWQYLVKISLQVEALWRVVQPGSPEPGCPFVLSFYSFTAP